jgi:hypothetical protein
MALVRILRALFPWYGLVGAGAAVFVFAEWLGASLMGPQAQSFCGAAAGSIIALGLLVRLHQLHHPYDVWRPSPSLDLSKAAKISGLVAGCAGTLDAVLRTAHSRFQLVTMAVAALLAITAGVLARMAKSAAAEESVPWKH